jgi:hypothetical protein
MPLIDNNNNSFSFTFIYLFEEVLVSLINENILQLWEENITILDKPVHLIWVKALLRELRWLGIMHSLGKLPPFHIPETMSSILESFKYILW